MLRQCFFYCCLLILHDTIHGLPYCKYLLNFSTSFQCFEAFPNQPRYKHINSNYSSYLLYSTVALHTCKNMIKNILFSTIIFYHFLWVFYMLPMELFFPMNGLGPVPSWNSRQYESWRHCQQKQLNTSTATWAPICWRQLYDHASVRLIYVSDDGKWM